MSLVNFFRARHTKPGAQRVLGSGYFGNALRNFADRVKENRAKAAQKKLERNTHRAIQESLSGDYYEVPIPRVTTSSSQRTTGDQNRQVEPTEEVTTRFKGFIEAFVAHNRRPNVTADGVIVRHCPLPKDVTVYDTPDALRADIAADWFSGKIQDEDSSAILRLAQSTGDIDGSKKLIDHFTTNLDLNNPDLLKGLEAQLSLYKQGLQADRQSPMDHNGGQDSLFQLLAHTIQGIHQSSSLQYELTKLFVARLLFVRDLLDRDAIRSGGKNTVATQRAA